MSISISTSATIGAWKCNFRTFLGNYDKRCDGQNYETGERVKEDIGLRDTSYLEGNTKF